MKPRSHVYDCHVFVRLLPIYLGLSKKLQKAARDMAAVYHAENATREERVAAMSTIHDILFPSPAVELQVAAD